jgi:hypothetical protein
LAGMIPRCGPSSTQLQNIFFLRSIVGGSWAEMDEVAER